MTATDKRARGWLSLALLACAWALGGCSVLQGGRLLAPETSGLQAVGPRLYIEAGDDPHEQVRRAQALQQAMEQAEAAVRKGFGSVRSQPKVHACFTPACYTRFGGGTSAAKVYGDFILLSPRGLNWHFLAHEWSHTEMRNRLSWRGWWHMPQWFEEGVAVAISEAPEHSEAHWRWLVEQDVPRPSPQGLRRLRSLSDWYTAVHRYGDEQNPARLARGEPPRNPLYAAAGHEVRAWLAQVGTDGLLRLIEQVNAGSPFDAAYDAARASQAPR